MALSTLPNIDAAAILQHPIEVRLPHLSDYQPFVQLKQEVATADSPLTTTFGWDTVFAITLKDVNAAIKKAATSPKTFQFTSPDGSIAIEGNFGIWQAHWGGQGSLLWMAIPITKGTYQFQGRTIPMAGITAIIEVQLDCLPPEKSSTDTNANSKLALRLVVRTKASKPDDPVVSVRSLSFTTPPAKAEDPALMKYALGEWFNQHLKEFAHVFCSINLNVKADKGQYQWLKPKKTSYACLKGTSEIDSYLGVLCMTQDNSPAELAPQLDLNVVPKGSRAGFLISQQRFLEEMVLPGLPRAFPGSQCSDFSMSSDQTKICNTTTIKLKPVTNAGTPYYPEMISLEISIDGTELQFATKTQVNIGLGTVALITVTNYLRIVLATKPDGSQTLSYEESRPPLKDHSLTTEAKGEALKIFLEILVVLIGIILVIVTDGAALGAAIIIVSLLIGLMDAIPKTIADVVAKKISNDSPSLDPFVSQSTNTISWSDSADFKLTWAGLATCLQLGGNPGFAT